MLLVISCRHTNFSLLIVQLVTRLSVLVLQVEWAREHLEKAMPVKDVFQMNEIVDVIGVTKGHGFKGSPPTTFLFLKKKCILHKLKEKPPHYMYMQVSKRYLGNE